MPVLKVRLGEREDERTLPVAGRQIDRERFAAPEQVIGRVFETEERAADAGDAAVKGNLLAAALVHFDRHVNFAAFLVLPEVNVLFFVNRIEEAELVEAQDREFQIALVVNVAFVQDDLAAQHIVAREGVALKLQPAQTELLALLNRDGVINDAFFRVGRIVFECRFGVGHILDEAVVAISFLQVFKERFIDTLAARHVALLQAEQGLDALLAEDRVAFDFEIAQPVEPAFDDGDRDAQTFVHR